MRTLEVIHLRLAGRAPEELAATIAAAAGEETEAGDILIYRHGWLETDLLVHVHRKALDDRLSLLGIRIASLLRDHGMVEHSIWVQESLEPDA